MDKDWIPIIGTLLGVIVTGTLGIVLKIFEQRSQRKQEAKKLYVSKLEELHAALWHLHNMEIESAAKRVTNATSSYDYKEVAENALKVRRLTMIYLPEAENQLKELLKACYSFGEFTREPTNAREKAAYKDLSEEVIKKLTPILADIEGKIRELLR